MSAIETTRAILLGENTTNDLKHIKDCRLPRGRRRIEGKNTPADNGSTPNAG